MLFDGVRLETGATASGHASITPVFHVADVPALGVALVLKESLGRESARHPQAPVGQARFGTSPSAPQQEELFGHFT